MSDSIDPGERSDLELIEALKSGSMSGFEALYNRYVKQIYWFAYRMLNNKERAEDVTQEVFIRLYRKAGHYKPVGKFSSWLYRLARNTVLNYIRDHQSAHSEISLSENPDNAEVSRSIENVLKDNSQDPSRVAATHEQQELVEIGLSQLKSEERQMIVLCVINGLPRKQVAEILGISENNVKIQLHRARLRLAKIIGIKEELL